MEMSTLTDHLLITLVAWIGGLTVGGGIGYLMASFVNPLMNAKPNARRIFALVPWRTLVFMLILLVWSPLLAIWLGLGNLTGIMMVGLTVSLLAWPMAMKARLNDWFPPKLRVRFISGSRSLLLFALLATLGAGFVGGGGFGFYLMQQVNLLEYGKLVEGFLLLGGVALIFDLILGIVEYRATF
jgi:ABC-type nitrate/sulfonate/bicarbonate transport system permease component